MDSSFHININKQAELKGLFFIVSRIYFLVDILPLENGITINDNPRIISITFENLKIYFKIIEERIIIVLSHGIISDITHKKRRHSTMKSTIKASFYK